LVAILASWSPYFVSILDGAFRSLESLAASMSFIIAVVFTEEGPVTAADLGGGGEATAVVVGKGGAVAVGVGEGAVVPAVVPPPAAEVEVEANPPALVDREVESAVAAVELIVGAEVVVEAAEVLTAVALAAGVGETGSNDCISHTAL
jgi:hypothetical protein